MRNKSCFRKKVLSDACSTAVFTMATHTTINFDSKTAFWQTPSLATLPFKEFVLTLAYIRKTLEIPATRVILKNIHPDKRYITVVFFLNTSKSISAATTRRCVFKLYKNASLSALQRPLVRQCDAWANSGERLRREGVLTAVAWRRISRSHLEKLGL